MSKTVQAICPASGKIIHARRRRRTATRAASSAVPVTAALRPTTARRAAATTSAAVAGMGDPARRVEPATTRNRVMEDQVDHESDAG
jgi:hypothetical protein